MHSQTLTGTYGALQNNKLLNIITAQTSSSQTQSLIRIHEFKNPSTIEGLKTMDTYRQVATVFGRGSSKIKGGAKRPRKLYINYSWGVWSKNVIITALS